MKAIIAITLIGILGNTAIPAQSLRYPLAIPYTVLSTYSKLQNDPFCFTANPAALSSVQHAGIAVYGERRFLLAETSDYRFAAVAPTPLGNFGLQVDYGGFANFNENTVGLAYGRSLGPKLDLGIQFNYYGYRVPGYGTASTVNFEAGAILHLTDRLNTGIYLYNPVGGKLGKASGEKLASAYRFGLGYDVSENFFAGASIEKEEDRPVNVIGGIQYHFARQFFARAGIISESGAVFAGAGVGWHKLRIDLSVSYHPQLGVTPGVLLVAGW